jgi:hypothetical protein
LAQEKLQKNMHSKIIAKILLRFTKINKLPRQGGVKPQLSKEQAPTFKGAGRIYLLTFRFIKFLYLPTGRQAQFF